MKNNIFLSIICFCILNTQAQTNQWNDSLKIDWLKSNAINITSVSSYNTDFADLVPLKTVLKNVKIVMLGEEAHGEGNVTSAKIRLIKYLHEQLGFDVLAFEVPFDAVNKASLDIKKGTAVDSVLNNILYPWASMTEFTALPNYIDSCCRSKSPFVVYGFDSQLWSGLTNLTNDLERTYEGITPLTSIEKKSFYTFLDSISKLRHPSFNTINDSLNCFKTLDLYSNLSDKIINNDSAAYWKQFFKSIKGNAIMALYYAKYANEKDKPWHIIAGSRDKQMADNLMWIIERNPNKKIIVWAASNHLSRNLKTLKEVSDTAFYAHYKPMGEYIKDKYGDKAYSLGFTAAGGTWFTKWQMPAPKEVKPAKNNSIECYMQRANFNYGIINYRNLPKDNFLNQEIYSNPFGHAHILGIWPNILDGIFFINEIIPPVYKN